MKVTFSRSVYLCVVYDSHVNKPFFPLTTLTGQSVVVMTTRCGTCAEETEIMNSVHYN